MKIAEHELTVKEFAELVGITANHMSGILHGKRKLSRLVSQSITHAIEKLERSCSESESA